MNTEFLNEMNEQMNFELESAYIYKTMSAYLSDLDLDGMVTFMDFQVEEEVLHADDFKNFLEEVGHRVHYRPLDPGNGEFDSVLDVFQTALDHEKLVTSHINRLYDKAVEIRDRKSEIFLQKYIEEQMEEEDLFSKIVTRLERIDGNWQGLYMLDNELGQRTPPVTPGEENL